MNRIIRSFMQLLNPSGEEYVLSEDIDEKDRDELLDKAADEIVRRGLTAPAIFLLESCSPLNFIGSQAMIALEPFVQAIFDLPSYRKFALLMERDENIRRLISLIECKEQQQKGAKDKR